MCKVIEEGAEGTEGHGPITPTTLRPHRLLEGLYVGEVSAVPVAGAESVDPGGLVQMLGDVVAVRAVRARQEPRGTRRHFPCQRPSAQEST